VDFHEREASVSIFGSILNSIFHHSATPQASAATPGSATAGAAQAGAAGGSAAPGAPQQSAKGMSASQAGAGASTGAAAGAGTSASAGAPAGGIQNIDVEAVLEKLAASKGGGGNWRTSIVDLLKLLGLDSSLAARKQLADELDVHAAADGSAEQNIALQKAVMRKLAENGGKVPDSLRH
jgi:hypothetical protein